MSLYKLAMAYVWPEPQSMLFLSQASAARFHERHYPNSSQPGHYFVGEADVPEVDKPVFVTFGDVRKRQLGITFHDSDGAVFPSLDAALAHVVKHGRWPAYADERLRYKMALRDGLVKPFVGNELTEFQQHFLRDEEAGLYRD